MLPTAPAAIREQWPRPRRGPQCPEVAFAVEIHTVGMALIPESARVSLANLCHQSKPASSVCGSSGLPERLFVHVQTNPECLHFVPSKLSQDVFHAAQPGNGLRRPIRQENKAGPLSRQTGEHPLCRPARKQMRRGQDCRAARAAAGHHRSVSSRLHSDYFSGLLQQSFLRGRPGIVETGQLRQQRGNTPIPGKAAFEFMRLADDFFAFRLGRFL